MTTAAVLSDVENYAGIVAGWLDSNDLALDEQVRFLAAIRDLRADLAAIASDVEREVVAKAPRRFVVGGLGEVQVRKSMKRTQWDDEGLARVVVARALDERILDESTGEYESGAEVVARVLMECARPSWRVTPLRDRGIAPDEFCHEEPDHLSVQLPPRRSGA